MSIYSYHSILILHIVFHTFLNLFRLGYFLFRLDLTIGAVGNQNKFGSKVPYLGNLNRCQASTIERMKQVTGMYLWTFRVPGPHRWFNYPSREYFWKIIAVLKINAVLLTMQTDWSQATAHQTVPVQQDVQIFEPTDEKSRILEWLERYKCFSLLRSIGQRQDQGECPDEQNVARGLQWVQKVLPT